MTTTCNKEPKEIFFSTCFCTLVPHRSNPKQQPERSSEYKCTGQKAPTTEVDGKKTKIAEREARKNKIHTHSWTFHSKPAVLFFLPKMRVIPPTPEPGMPARQRAMQNPRSRPLLLPPRPLPFTLRCRSGRLPSSTPPITRH